MKENKKYDKKPKKEIVFSENVVIICPFCFEPSMILGITKNKEKDFFRCSKCKTLGFFRDSLVENTLENIADIISKCANSPHIIEQLLCVFPEDRPMACLFCNNSSSTYFTKCKGKKKGRLFMGCDNCKGRLFFKDIHATMIELHTKIVKGEL